MQFGKCAKHISSTSARENITKTSKVLHGWPMYSYNGKYCYYSPAESSVYTICKINLDGTNKVKLTNSVAGKEDARVFVSHSGDFMIHNKKIGKAIDTRKCKN